MDLSALRDRFLGHDPRFRRFVVLLAAATAIPMLGVPLMGGAHPDQTALLSAAGLLSFFGGPGHVALTTWFFADPLARDHFLANPMRYFVVPAFLIVGTTAAYVVWQEEAPTRWINFAFTIWLLWHYQRQNWGVHSFVTRVMSGSSASKLEEWILKLAVVGGIIGGIHSAGFGGGIIPAEHTETAFRVGASITMLLPVLIVAALATQPGLRATPLRICSLVGTAGFFLPVFVFKNPNNAVLPYALAHGLQYAVFMSYVARSTHGDAADAAVTATAPVTTAPATLAPIRPGVLTMLAGLVVVGLALRTMGNVSVLKEWNLMPLFGLTLGITMAHFVIDAGIWRLRDEFPRRYVGAAFPFLSPRPR